MNALYADSRETHRSTPSQFRYGSTFVKVFIRPRSAVCVALVCLPLAGFTLQAKSVRAEFPETLARAGRLCGCSWGDGYHTCSSSGVRPLADLPPRSYPARVGSLDERMAGCPTCQPRMLPGVDPITSPGGPVTFYHRFDLYAAQVSHREASAANSGPVQPMIDPEAGIARPRSPREFQSQRPDYLNGSAESTSPPATKTADGTPAAPALSEAELEEFRQYQAEKKLRKKFDKYMVDPEDIEPSQIFGGPPVGSEERRRIDEAKLRELQAEIRQRERQDAASDRLPSEPDNTLPRASEDRLPSPSDRNLPMDELLPPFPGDEVDLLDQPLDRAPSNRPQIETIPAGPGERVDPLDSVRIGSPPHSFVRQPEARVAGVPNWRFIKQPR